MQTACACCCARSKCDSPDHSFASASASAAVPAMCNGLPSARRNPAARPVRTRATPPVCAGQQQNPLPDAQKNDGRDKHQKNSGNGSVKKVVKLQRAIFLQCFLGDVHGRHIAGGVCGVERLLQTGRFFSQRLSLCQKTDSWIGTPDFLHAGGERHRHQPDQRDQRDERSEMLVSGAFEPSRPAASLRRCNCIFKIIVVPRHNAMAASI